ncbi:ras-related protein Rab-22A isoform X2 [Ascaphus truei]|uniref:ras-related protein Rab-22A isoform X2 n=1 Tax=Ascaphus truei TaxID=8439 RepID=UPI003F595AF1
MAVRELKVCLLGDTGVGKSSIVWSASFMTKTVQYQNELHKFLIWDTAGQERFRALAPMYYRGSTAAIIVYDITKEDTFSTLKNWVKELRQHGPPNIVVAIAGNKCDLNDLREVVEKDAKDYADSINAIFVETSAKIAININELFIEIKVKRGEQLSTIVVKWSVCIHPTAGSNTAVSGTARPAVWDRNVGWVGGYLRPPLLPERALSLGGRRP